MSRFAAPHLQKNRYKPRKLLFIDGIITCIFATLRDWKFLPILLELRAKVSMLGNWNEQTNLPALCGFPYSLGGSGCNVPNNCTCGGRWVGLDGNFGLLRHPGPGRLVAPPPLVRWIEWRIERWFLRR